MTIQTTTTSSASYPYVPIDTVKELSEYIVDLSFQLGTMQIKVDKKLQLVTTANKISLEKFDRMREISRNAHQSLNEIARKIHLLENEANNPRDLAIAQVRTVWAPQIEVLRSKRVILSSSITGFEKLVALYGNLRQIEINFEKIKEEIKSYNDGSRLDVRRDYVYKCLNDLKNKTQTVFSLPRFQPANCELAKEKQKNILKDIYAEEFKLNIAESNNYKKIEDILNLISNRNAPSKVKEAIQVLPARLFKEVQFQLNLNRVDLNDNNFKKPEDLNVLEAALREVLKLHVHYQVQDSQKSIKSDPSSEEQVVPQRPQWFDPIIKEVQSKLSLENIDFKHDTFEKLELSESLKKSMEEILLAHVRSQMQSSQKLIKSNSSSEEEIKTQKNQPKSPAKLNDSSLNSNVRKIKRRSITESPLKPTKVPEKPFAKRRNSIVEAGIQRFSGNTDPNLLNKNFSALPGVSKGTPPLKTFPEVPNIADSKINTVSLEVLQEVIPLTLNPVAVPNISVKVVEPQYSTLVIKCRDVPDGQTLFIRGDGSGLSWEKGVALKRKGEEIWEVELPEATSNFQYKLILNDDSSKWEAGENHKGTIGKNLPVEAHFSSSILPPIPRTVVEVDFPVPQGKTLYLCGGGPLGNWDQDVPLIDLGNNKWGYTFKGHTQGFEYKFRLDKAWEKGSNHKAECGKKQNFSSLKF